MVALPERVEVVAEGPKRAVRAVGTRLGEAAQPGDVVALVGGLGAGKTFLAQCIARGVGVPERVRVASPTFTIVQRYDARIPFFHADLYRVGSAREVDELGLFAQGADGLVVVEWPERAPEAIPRDALWLELVRTAPLRRRVLSAAPSERARRLLEAARRGA